MIVSEGIVTLSKILCRYRKGKKVLQTPRQLLTLPQMTEYRIFQTQTLQVRIFDLMKMTENSPNG